VSFAATDTPHVVAPHVQSTAVRGVDAAAKAQLWGRSVVRSGHVLSTLTRVQERARFTVAGVSWARSTKLSGDDVIVQVRVREDSGWSDWETPGVTDEGPQGGTTESATARLGTNPLVTDGATAIQVRVDTTSGQALPDVRVTTINPGTSSADDDLVPHSPAASASAAATTPTIITRKQWGADESLRGATTYNTTVKAITIHHTASSNDYTAATAAAQIRGIYAYDTKGLGWSDIAYNFLVDKFGRIYEGRAGSITKAVRGAHAMGFNTNTMGIAALGNYQTTAAPAVMVDSLAKVAGWKLSQFGVDPSATTKLTSAGGIGAKFATGAVATLQTINAHQNTSYTLCPGKNLFPLMGTIRSKATLYVKDSSTTGPAPITTHNLFAAYGTLTLASGSTGWAVRDLQLELNRRGLAAGTADGTFGASTVTAMKAFQKAAYLTTTGTVTANDWRALSRLSYVQTAPPPPPPVTPVNTKPIAGFNADGIGDVLGRTTAGDLYFYPAKVGGIGTPVRISGGWNAYRQVFSPGDITGDRISDLIAISTTGYAYLFKGNGKGGLQAGSTLLSRSWAAYTDILTPGDWTGDGKPDLLARGANGDLLLAAGDGKGWFPGAWRRVGMGWQMFSQIITPGDVTGDGHADLLGRTAAGKLYLYKGTGITTGTASGMLPGVVVGSAGWQAFNTVLSTGDLTGDGKADLIARTPANIDYVYAGTGKGTFASAKKFTAPWGATTRITGVR
jgi:peptidoglycan hydrolase-like protein with peptidoglycan-binding domain